MRPISTPQLRHNGAAPPRLALACAISVAGVLAFGGVGLAAGPDLQGSGTHASNAGAGDLERDSWRFLEVGRDFRREVNSYVRAELEAKRRQLESMLDSAVSRGDTALQSRRLAAIAYFEEFLERHPNQPEHTPDAMFRLAELYFEKGAIDLERFNRDENTAALLGDLDPMDVAFGDSIRLYRGLTVQFPDYRHSDAAHYVLGYLYEETGRPDEALSAFAALQERYPNSDYASEANLRMGEIYFDAGDWERAASAYERAAAVEGSRFYDKALYKLAWTHFQRFDYDRAIKQFTALIGYYDAQGDSGALATELRSEAIEYLARSLAEDDWDGDGEVDATAGVVRAWSYLSAGEPYEREVIEAYANALYELHEESKYLEAVDVYERLVARSPQHARNPELVERVVAIFDIVGQRDRAATRRSELVDQFGPKSAWYAANRGNLDALARADAMVELAMRQQAQLEHKAAQDLRRAALDASDSSKLVAASDAYGRAADGYQRYLDAFPKSQYASDMQFYLGETLFFTGRFRAAADVYERVREGGDARYLEPAAFSAVKALEQAIDAEVAEGRIPAASSPSADFEEPEDGEVNAVPVPEIVTRWIRSIDAYTDRALHRSNETDTGSKLQYQAALVLSRLGATADARQRAEKVVDANPQSEVGGFAATLVIDGYRRENDWDNIEKWARRIDEEGIGQPGDQAKLREEIRTFKLGAQFQRAEQLLEGEKFVDAAKEFERIVDADVSGSLEFADKALYNAALAYERAKHYDSAARVFERVVTEPRYAASPYYDDALFRLAENHNRFFNFDRAAQRYLALVDRNPQHGSAPFSLYKAAQLAENEGNHRDAARLYERYHDLYPARDDVSGVLFSAVEAWEATGEREEADRVARQLVESYDAVPAAAPLVVRATLKLANSALARNRKPDAARLYQRVIAEFQARGLQVGTADASLPAEAQFRLSELKFEEYRGIKLQGSLTAMGRQIKRKQMLLGELETAYAEIFAYKSLEWTFAGYFRIGQIYQEFADMLYSAPEPSGLSEEELEVYQLELEDIGVRFEDTAVERYETTVQKARELKFKNQWTEQALRAVNRYRPAEYPLQREPKRELIFFPFLEPVLAHTGQVVGSGESPHRDDSPGEAVGDDAGGEAEAVTQ